LLPPPTQHHSFFRNFHPLINKQTDKQTNKQVKEKSKTKQKQQQKQTNSIKWDISILDKMVDSYCKN